MNENTWYLRTQDETFGPEAKEKLVEWARMGRILPGQEVSDDNLIWRRVEEVPFLDMRFSIDIGDGNPRGPFNRAAADALIASGRLPPGAKIVEVRDPFPEETTSASVEASTAPVPEEPTSTSEEASAAPEETAAAPEEMPATSEETPSAAEPLAASALHQDGLPGLEPPQDEPQEAAVSAPSAESVVEPPAPAGQPPEQPIAQPVEKPVGTVVEKVVEKVVEVPVEKIVEKVVVDETRVKDLEAQLEEERRRSSELQVRLDAATKDLELQREDFQRKSEAAAQDLAARLEDARQKAEIAAQDAEARHLSEQKATEAQLADARRKIEDDRKEFAVQFDQAKSEAESRLAEVRQEAEAAQKDAESRLAEVRQKAEAAQKDADARLAEVRQKAEAAQKDADAREAKSREQIVALENELRRLPQAASEIADVQAAVYSIMTKEAAELAEIIETEKREADAFRRRQQERADRLLERRRELLKRTGANIEDMTRKALVERPEDPRTVQLRREYEEFRRADEKKSRAYEDKLLAKSREIEELRREISRRNVSDKDATQLQAEAVALREKLQRCEKDLMSERQQCEELRQRQATNQQVLMARLATLESPTIAPAGSFAASANETRQSREAKSVKLPRWMQLGGKR